jgi:hypothetical protein
MQAIEGAVSETIAQMDGQSVKTDQGTAYRSTPLSVRCTDRESLFDYVKTHDAFDLLATNGNGGRHVCRPEPAFPGVPVAALPAIRSAPDTVGSVAKSPLIPFASKEDEAEEGF